MPEQDDPVKRAAEYVRRPNSSAFDYVLSGFNGLAKWIVLIFGGIILLLFGLGILANVFGVVLLGTADAAPWLLFGVVIFSIPIIFFAVVFIFFRKLWLWSKARKE